MPAQPAHPELGFYTLAGAPKSPRDMFQELRDAEGMGLGTAFISERFNIKEAGAHGCCHWRNEQHQHCYCGHQPHHASPHCERIMGQHIAHHV